jgi:hypothetical protein
MYGIDAMSDSGAALGLKENITRDGIQRALPLAIAGWAFGPHEQGGLECT